jgi:hypothetical protein
MGYLHPPILFLCFLRTEQSLNPYNRSLDTLFSLHPASSIEVFLRITFMLRIWICFNRINYEDHENLFSSNASAELLSQAPQLTKEFYGTASALEIHGKQPALEKEQLIIFS